MINGQNANRSQFSGSALEALYKNYRTPIIIWLVKNFPLDKEEATEVCQEAFAIFVEKVASDDITSFKAQSKVTTYLFGIAKNKARERLRQLDRFVSLPVSASETPEEDDKLEKEEKEIQIKRALKAMDQLGEKCRQLLLLAIVHKMSMEEIAQRLGYENAQTAKNMKYKCLKQLRKWFYQL